MLIVFLFYYLGLVVEPTHEKCFTSMLPLQPSLSNALSGDI